MKAIVIILLALGIFGGAYYATWVLYLEPQAQIRQEKLAPPAPPPPDPALPEYTRILALQESGDTMGARAAWADFIEHYPQSTKTDEVKERLGQINISLYLSPVPTPEKVVYIVKPGDVINKVAARNKSTPELLMRTNNLQGSMLRIGQRLVIAPADFSLAIQRRNRKVVLLRQDKFFKQYAVLDMSAQLKAAAEKKQSGKPQRIAGKVGEKIAWSNGMRIPFTDKAYQTADHWILLSPGGNNLYTEPTAQPGAAPSQNPPGGGYALAAESMRELAAMVRKGDAVTIE